MRQYLIVIEKAKGNYSAYLPDLPGCVATGQTKQEAEERMRDGIRMHLAGLAEDGLPIPQPFASAEYVEV